jgi:hypothetical protein
MPGGSKFAYDVINFINAGLDVIKVGPKCALNLTKILSDFGLQYYRGQSQLHSK